MKINNYLLPAKTICLASMRPSGRRSVMTCCKMSAPMKEYVPVWQEQNDTDITDYSEWFQDSTTPRTVALNNYLWKQPPSTTNPGHQCTPFKDNNHDDLRQLGGKRQRATTHRLLTIWRTTPVVLNPGYSNCLSVIGVTFKGNCPGNKLS